MNGILWNKYRMYECYSNIEECAFCTVRGMYVMSISTNEKNRQLIRAFWNNFMWIQ